MKDLRSFLTQIEKESPEQLIRVESPIDPNLFEVTAFLHHLEKRGHPCITLFEKVKDLKGSDTQIRLAYNMFVTRSLCARALDLPATADGMELTREFALREGQPGRTVRVESAEAPCKQNVLRGNKVDLRSLPVPMHHQLDAGPYLTMVCAMKSPEGGFYNLTFTKNMVKGRRKLSLSAHPHHHLDHILGEYEHLQKRAPVVIILGHHPAFFLSTCCLTGYGNHDYDTASSFLGEAVRLTPSETWGEDFLVPADAEIVIEGEVPLGVQEYQNPFGEILGYYQAEAMQSVVEVTAVTYRDKPILQGIFPGHSEHFVLGGIPKEGSTFNSIRKHIPGVRAVHLPDSGCGRLTCYISMHKDFESDPRKAAMQAFVEMPNLKLVVVVDEDVDVYDERAVLWAVACCTRWDRDLQVVEKVQSVRKWLGDAVAIVDATRPEEEDFPTKNEIPHDALDRVQVDQYLR